MIITQNFGFLTMRYFLHDVAIVTLPSNFDIRKPVVSVPSCDFVISILQGKNYNPPLGVLTPPRMVPRIRLQIYMLAYSSIWAAKNKSFFKSSPGRIERPVSGPWRLGDFFNLAPNVVWNANHPEVKLLTLLHRLPGLRKRFMYPRVFDVHIRRTTYHGGQP